jgi:hypothetical protein
LARLNIFGSKSADSTSSDFFNHPLVKEKISNPSLRAALVGPGRTVAVDAIEFILFAQTAESLPK